MERHGVAVPAMPLEPFAHIYEHEGPFATAVVSTPGDIDRAAERNRLAWRPHRDSLADLHVDEAVLQELDDLIGENHEHAAGLAAVTTRERVLHIEPLNDAGTETRARVASLPSLVPIIAARQARPSTVVVLADRTGADLWVVDGRGPDEGDPDHPGGGVDPLHKAAAGGWSQKRNQRRAENVWRHNADDVGAAVVARAARAKAQLVALGGDGRAVDMIEDRIGDAVDARIVRVPEWRGGKTPRLDLDRDLAVARATVAAAATVEVLEKFREELRQLDRAVEGAADTLAALAGGRVDTLLVHDDWSSSAVAWFGPEGSQVAMSEGDVRAMGAAAADQGRLPDVAVRAATATGAGAWVVPGAGGPHDGIGAVLRW